MSRPVVFALALSLAAGVTAARLTAHHSFAAQYDRDKPVTLKGAVTRIEWANPHIYFYMDVQEAAGVVNWAIEGGAPTSLYRAGWRKDSMKIGDVVTVNGFLARDGTKLANMRNAILADGREVFGGQQYYSGTTGKPPGK
jgi:hypothetical protein